MVEMFDKLFNTFSIDRLSPQRDMATFVTSVVAPAVTIRSQEMYEQFPVLSFTCPSGRIPIVLGMDYVADNCNLDLGPSFRFPCNGTNVSCTRTDIRQVDRRDVHGALCGWGPRRCDNGGQNATDVFPNPILSPIHFSTCTLASPRSPWTRRTHCPKITRSTPRRSATCASTGARASPSWGS